MSTKYFEPDASRDERNRNLALEFHEIGIEVTPDDAGKIFHIVVELMTKEIGINIEKLKSQEERIDAALSKLSIEPTSTIIVVTFIVLGIVFLLTRLLA